MEIHTAVGRIDQSLSGRGGLIDRVEALETESKETTKIRYKLVGAAIALSTVGSTIGHKLSTLFTAAGKNPAEH